MLGVFTVERQIRNSAHCKLEREDARPVSKHRRDATMWDGITGKRDFYIPDFSVEGRIH